MLGHSVFCLFCNSQQCHNIQLALHCVLSLYKKKYPQNIAHPSASPPPVPQSAESALVSEAEVEGWTIRLRKAGMGLIPPAMLFSVMVGSLASLLLPMDIN